MCARCFFFFSSRRRHTRCSRDWSSDVCSSDLLAAPSEDSRFAPARNNRGPTGLRRESAALAGDLMPWQFQAAAAAHHLTPKGVSLPGGRIEDRKSTRLNSSHGYISYAVFCLKKKTIINLDI